MWEPFVQFRMNATGPMRFRVNGTLLRVKKPFALCGPPIAGNRDCGPEGALAIRRSGHGELQADFMSPMIWRSKAMAAGGKRRPSRVITCERPRCSRAFFIGRNATRSRSFGDMESRDASE